CRSGGRVGGTEPAGVGALERAAELSHRGSSGVMAVRLLPPTTASDESLEKNTRRAAVWATCGAPPCATCVAHNRAFCHVGGRECRPVLTGELRQAAASRHLCLVTGPDAGAADRVRGRGRGGVSGAGGRLTLTRGQGVSWVDD